MLSRKHLFIASKPIGTLWVLMGWATVKLRPAQGSLTTSQSNGLSVQQGQQALTEQGRSSINRLFVSVALRLSIKCGDRNPIQHLQTAARYLLHHFFNQIIPYRANPRLEIPDNCLHSSSSKAEKFRSPSYGISNKKNISIEYALKVNKACYSWLRAWMKPIGSAIQKINITSKLSLLIYNLIFQY